MSGSDKVEAQGGEHAHDPGPGEDVVPPKKSPARPADLGRALRSVYDDTLREDIPADLKDLLGRLG